MVQHIKALCKAVQSLSNWKMLDTIIGVTKQKETTEMLAFRYLKDSPSKQK